MKKAWIFAIAILGGVFASSAVAPNAAAFHTADHASVEGNVDAQINGRRAGCNAALLIPQSPAADKEIQMSFGDIQRGIKVLGKAELQSLTSAENTKTLGSRQVSCSSYPWSFSFEGVKPGEYYLTALVSASGEQLEPGFPGEVQNAVLMQRITVEPGRNMRVSMKD